MSEHSHPSPPQAPQAHIFRFGLVRVHIARDLSHIRTELPGGGEVNAAPNFDHESKARAVALGYDGDTRLMSAEHEICHTLLARAIGSACSPTLRRVAGGPDVGQFARVAEESIVLALQAMANGKPPHPWSEVLRLFGVDPKGIVEQLLRIRRKLKPSQTPQA